MLHSFFPTSTLHYQNDFMQKEFLYFIYLLIISFNTNAQADNQISIQAEEGILTVSKTTGGKDIIIMSIACWDKMVAGTKYCSWNLSGVANKKICIQITDKKHGHCRKGIGFGCSIFDCPDVPDELPNKVDNENRICAITVKKIKGAVKIIFDDKVDWQSLQNIRTGDDD
jgi:hypothetical protein